MAMPVIESHDYSPVMDTKPFTIPFQGKPEPMEALEQTLDNHRLTLLELAHRRAAFELKQHMAEQTAKLALEVYAYTALLTGVPETDIYELGEDMAEALESAMNTVAQA